MAVLVVGAFVEAGMAEGALEVWAWPAVLARLVLGRHED